MTDYSLRVFKQIQGVAKAARLVKEVGIRADEDLAAVQEAAKMCAAYGDDADFARLFAPDRTIVWCADRPFVPAPTAMTDA